MSGGEPSSIKRLFLCAAVNLRILMRKSVPCLFCISAGEERSGKSLYQALYRKYRPKTFDDVVGQPHITRTLQNEVKAGKTAQAYLFTGSRGTGKTTCS